MHWRTIRHNRSSKQERLLWSAKTRAATALTRAIFLFTRTHEFLSLHLQTKLGGGWSSMATSYNCSINAQRHKVHRPSLPAHRPPNSRWISSTVRKIIWNSGRAFDRRTGTFWTYPPRQVLAFEPARDVLPRVCLTHTYVPYWKPLWWSLLLKILRLKGATLGSSRSRDTAYH